MFGQKGLYFGKQPFFMKYFYTFEENMLTHVSVIMLNMCIMFLCRFLHKNENNKKG